MTIMKKHRYQKRKFSKTIVQLSTMWVEINPRDGGWSLQALTSGKIILSYN